MNRPIVGKLYRHKKGGVYQVIGFAVHTETEECLVLYIDPEYIFNDQVMPWARPVDMFCDDRFTESEDER